MLEEDGNALELSQTDDFLVHCVDVGSLETGQWIPRTRDQIA